MLRRRRIRLCSVPGHGPHREDGGQHAPIVRCPGLGSTSALGSVSIGAESLLETVIERGFVDHVTA